ncbi:MAG: hypothetical protein GY697_19540, partial [Desulfobacterales bacterium]|nr:hypothetical protein [Desulfobacterales bacterium]
QPSLETLHGLLRRYLHAIRGMHVVPACPAVAERFPADYLSQVVRNKIHAGFGTNQKFAQMMARYYSMADFVLNHVDIRNPDFQAYLDGDDARGDCFYIFSEDEYRRRLRNGDFSQVFRPRPFPLFSVFRRMPADKTAASRDRHGKVKQMAALLENRLPEPVIGLLSIFNKLKNDQMLLDEDYREITRFQEYLTGQGLVAGDTIFTKSVTQETRHIPYILKSSIQTQADLIVAMGYEPETAQALATLFARHEAGIFGEEIRALTTFSHVQVDLNTATFQGLKMLADDFAWYLGLDLDMLRLDAANFAFKRWQSTCFGLPEVKGLMEILYLSMDCVAPRMVANLEVNDQFSAVLTQMADRQAPPPMMYDFHLAGMLPVAFITEDARIFKRISNMMATYDISPGSIRFSLAESHDGKSVRGSLDLLTLAERQSMADTVENNGGWIKYKGVPRREYRVTEFEEVCSESDLDFITACNQIFKVGTLDDDVRVLADPIRDVASMAAALGISPDRFTAEGPLKYFANKILGGREPYELCVATRDCLPLLSDPRLAAARYLSFYTLAFALMGRNVKSIYFNDLMGLPNDYARLQETGELRDLKRTKSSLANLERQLADPATFEYQIARGMNNLIALVDSDAALSPRGNEADVCVDTGQPGFMALVHCSSDTHTLVAVNVSQKPATVTIDPAEFGFTHNGPLYDNIGNRSVSPGPEAAVPLEIKPFGRLWLTEEKVVIPAERLVDIPGS